MNRIMRKRALIVAMTTGVLFILLALGLASGVLALLVPGGAQSLREWWGRRGER